MEEVQDIDNKSVKVNCSFCGKEIECPEDMLQKSKKHMCYDCFKNAKELVKEEELKEIHVDIPVNEMNEFVSEHLTNSLVEEIFPNVWKERKKELKEMSKKDLAEGMFRIGAYIAIQEMVSIIKQKENVEDKKDESQNT